MKQKRTNIVSKVVEWSSKIDIQARLIVTHSSSELLVKNLHSEVYGSLIDDDKFNSKKLFQQLVLSHIKDNYSDIYRKALGL